MSEQSEDNGSPQPVATVSKAVLGAFLDDLSKNQGFEDIASTLKKVVIEDGVFAEPAIRVAIFPDAK